MKKKFLTFLLMPFTLVVLGQDKIEIPFFKTLSGIEICGSDDCNPTRGIWHNLDEGYLYNNPVEELLGRKFRTNIFDDHFPCVQVKPKSFQIDTLRTGELTGKLNINQRTQFKVQVRAQLADLIDRYIALPDSIKADFIAGLDHSIDKSTTSNVALTYYIIQIDDQSYIDDQILECRQSLRKPLIGRSEKVVVGLSVLQLSGSWVSNTLLDIFDQFEAQVAFKDYLDANAKVQYEKDKEKILNAEYDPFSIIFNVSYYMRYRNRG